MGMARNRCAGDAHRYHLECPDCSEPLATPDCRECRRQAQIVCRACRSLPPAFDRSIASTFGTLRRSLTGRKRPSAISLADLTYWACGVLLRLRPSTAADSDTGDPHERLQDVCTAPLEAKEALGAVRELVAVDLGGIALPFAAQLATHNSDAVHLVARVGRLCSGSATERERDSWERALQNSGSAATDRPRLDRVVGQPSAWRFLALAMLRQYRLGFSASDVESSPLPRMVMRRALDIAQSS